MNASITDPAVTLTDYGLAIECAAIVALLMRPQASDPTLRIWFVVFFAAAATASLLGGTVHGFFKPADSAARAILWPATLIAVLATGLAAWFAAARLQLEPRAESIARLIATLLLVAMALLVLFVTHNFAIAIAGYLPATLFLLYSLLVAYRRHRERAIAWGITGVSLALIGAAVQRLHVVIHPVYLDHNVFYHLLQGAAFWMIYKAARFLSTASPSLRRSNAVTA
jgi:hypothetical protein